jgi:hypothetical protein
VYHIPLVTTLDKEKSMFTSRKLIIPVLVVLMLFVSVSSVAAAPGNTQISGAGAFVSTAECSADSPNVYPPIRMTGGLAGCWYTDEVEVLHFTDNGAYQELGTETFIGCLSDGTTCGTFSTTYKFTAKYAADGSELHGHCEHKLVSGTGDFAGITGQVNFKDNVQTGDFLYEGHFKLP